MHTHTVKACTFTQKKVKNECFISPGDFKLTKLSTEGRIPYSLELEPKFLSRKRHSHRQKGQEYAQHHSSNSQQSEIIQNIQIKYVLS